MSELVSFDWPNIKILDLSTCFVNAAKNHISDEGIKHLVSKPWPKLEELYLGIVFTYN
jgi:hypothetical protein